MEPLEIPGHGGAALPCVLYGEASRCALVLPGAAGAGNRLGGSPARPDLHFTRTLLQEHDLSVLEVWWDADTLTRGEADPWLLANARAGWDAIAARGREPAVLVGRSLGTNALALLRASEPEAARLPSIWIAPLMHREDVRESLLHGGGGGRFVLCGGSDAAYDPALAPLLRERDADVVVLEGADHVLHCGDAAASARALAAALESMREFVARALPG